MLAGNIHELRQSRSGANVNSVVTFLVHEFINRDRPSHDHVGLELDSHLAHVLKLLADDLLRQAELRNAVNENTAKFMQSLEDANFVALLHQVTRDGEA